MKMPFLCRRFGFSLILTLGLGCAAWASDLSKYTTISDVEYKNADGKPLRLDVYFDPALSWKRPLVIYVHGGGWTGRTKADGLFYAEAFLQRGYAYASIDYRLSSDAIFPAQIEDVKAAIRFLRAHAADYRVDPDRIGLIGHSAGGELVSLAGTTNDDPQFDTGDNLGVSSAVQAVCDMSGPVDFLAPASALASMLEKLLGGPVDEKQDLAKLASPIDHVNPKCPPFLILHGEKDPAIPVEEASGFAAALQQAGVSAQLVILPGQPHDLNVWAHTGAGNFMGVITQFFDSVLKK